MQPLGNRNYLILTTNCVITKVTPKVAPGGQCDVYRIVAILSTQYTSFIHHPHPSYPPGTTTCISHVPYLSPVVGGVCGGAKLCKK